jgi:Carboxypeptidase regulatory-like domain/TonB-dependent Receptor Plug Domain
MRKSLRWNCAWMVLRGAFSAALAVLLLSILPVGSLYAQVAKATLSGTVVDPSGAVIADAKIQAKNVNTGVTYSASTDAQGRYILPELQVGSYEVSAQKSGFEQLVQTGITLSVGARPILDFKLSVGRSEQVVHVEGNASRVDTETSTVGQLLSPTQLENLPSNGRNFTDLLSLAPGVATVPASGGGGGQSATVYGTQTNYSVSGSRPVGLAYMLDNTDIRDALDHGAGVSVMGTSLGMEAIQEFSVLTNTYSAEFGGTGAAVNAVSKSGTNSFHGSAYEYFRNSVLDSSNYFDAPGQKPDFRRNQFGGSLGGAIKKDKAFFFVNYEGLRSGTGETSRATVPTTLPALFTAGGMTFNGTTWVGQYGPISPLTESIFGLYPLAQSFSQCPNVSNTQFLPGTGIYCSNQTQIGNEDYVLARGDYVFGAKDSLLARYVREGAYQVLPYVYSPIPGYPEIDNEHNQYFTIEERHMFSTTLLNEVRFGFVRLYTLTANGGVSGPPLQSAPGLQDMDFSPGQNISSLGPSPTSPSRPVTNRFSIGDDVILTLGDHSIHFGASVTRVQLNQIWDQYPGGAWIFANLGGNTVPNTPLGGSMYGFPLLCVCGAAPTYSYTTPSGVVYPFNDHRYWRQTWLDPYVQDDWRITKKLTLNIGLRYAWASNPTTVQQPVFVINNLTAPTTTQFDFVTAKHPFTSNPNKMNLDPRIGLAWDPFGDHKTSVRAGFGIFHEPVTARTYALDNTSFLPNAPLFFLFFSPTFPALPSNPATDASSIAWYYAILQNVDTSPYVMQYNLNVQRDLGHGMVLTVGYNGSSGNHLFLWADANPPLAYGDLSSADLNAPGAGGAPSVAQTFAGTGATGLGARGTVTNPFVGASGPGTFAHVNPNFQAVEAVQPRAHSTYNALQVTWTRQFSKSFAGNAGYTWSRCIDDASATISTEQGEWAVVDAYNPSLDRGPCSFSSDHVFTANAIYQFPFKGNKFVEGWQVSPIVSAYSGLPFNVQTMFGGLYQSQTGGATEGERPDRVPGCKAMVKSKTEWWNPECFVLSPFGTLGDSGRDSLNNPNFVNFDFAIFKDTHLTEKLTMQLRAEFFDILNHPNFVVGNQVYLMGTANTVAPSNPNYALRSDPAAYVPPVPGVSPGGLLCNPGQSPNGPVAGPCYTPGTGLTATMPGTNGGQRQIQFAVRFMF